MPSPTQLQTGLLRLVRAASNSTRGVADALRSERAFQQEAAAAVLLIPAAFWLGRTWVEVAVLAGSVIAVMVVELLNSSIEAVVDRVSLEWHELSRRAKDMGSAAVLLSLLYCTAVWLAALWRLAAERS